jgi:hypothetical protein
MMGRAVRVKRDRRKRLQAAGDLIERVNKLDNRELVDTLDLLLSNMTYYVPEYRRTGNQTLLVEISLLAETMYALCDVLKDRQIELAPDAIAAARQLRSWL